MKYCLICNSEITLPVWTQKRCSDCIRKIKNTKKKLKKKRYKIPRQIRCISGGLCRIRELARIRDGHKCQNCGKKWKKGKRRLDVHHMDEEMESVRNYKWDREHLDRLITYCHKCHLNLDSVRRKMSLAGMKVLTK